MECNTGSIEYYKKRIMSFDVGIKHMALCTIDINHDETRSIHDWKVLDLTGHIQDISVSVPCGCKTKTDKPCKSNAKYFKTTHYFCVRHAKTQTSFILPDKKFSTTALKKKKVQELHILGSDNCVWLPCDTPPSKMEMISMLSRWFDERCLETLFEKPSIVSAAKIDLITIGRNMSALLDLTPYLSTVTHVCIENQISPLAGRMKTLQGMLAQYFIVRCPRAHIEFVSSINKLKAFKNEQTSIESIPQNIDAYKQHKKDAIKYTLILLEKGTHLCNHLESFQNHTNTKKDDLADCFLQGIWYCTTI